MKKNRPKVTAPDTAMQISSMQEANETAPAQPYLIPRHIHLCETGNQVIFLDLRRDKYLAIGRAEREALSGVVNGWPADINVPASPETLQRRTTVAQSMLKLGLLTADARAGKQAAHPVVDVAREVLVDDDFERRVDIRAGHVAAFLFACACAKFWLRWRAFEQVIESARRRRAKSLERGVAFDLDRSRDLVAIFDRLRPFVFTSKDACLFDSLALIEFLALHGIYPAWLLGVQAQPFGAHSWVQHQQFVFNGTVEYVRRFTPILAV